jgi:hypothetical protein
MSQAVTFSSSVIPFNSMQWQKVLNRFGYVCFYAVSAEDLSGYAIFDNTASATAAAEQFNEKQYPPGSGNEISFQLCDLEELDLRVQLADPRIGQVKVSQPESAASLFEVTQTAPPIYWKRRSSS